MNLSKINILDEKEKASENLFFSKQDEALLKKIFENSQLSGELDTEGIFKEGGSNEDKIKLIFMKVSELKIPCHFFRTVFHHPPILS